MNESMKKRELGRLLVDLQRVRTSMHECDMCDRHYTDPNKFLECMLKCDVLQARLDSIKPEIKELTKTLILSS